MIDERFKIHRLYATRFSAIAGTVVAGFWFAYDFYIHDLFSWDLFTILMSIAAAKLAAMTYYKFTN